MARSFNAPALCNGAVCQRGACNELGQMHQKACLDSSGLAFREEASAINKVLSMRLLFSSVNLGVHCPAWRLFKMMCGAFSWLAKPRQPILISSYIMISRSRSFLKTVLPWSMLAGIPWAGAAVMVTFTTRRRCGVPQEVGGVIRSIGGGTRHLR